MKKIILLVFAVACHFCKAQKGRTIFYTNDDGTVMKVKNATRLVDRTKIDDTLWSFSIYKIYGEIIKTYYSKDEQGIIKDGDYFSRAQMVMTLLGISALIRKLGNGIFIQPRIDY